MSDIGIFIIIRGILSVSFIAAGYFIFHHGRKSIKENFSNPDTTAFSLKLWKITFTGKSGSILGTLFIGCSVFALAGAYVAPKSFETDGRNNHLTDIIGPISVPVAALSLSKDPEENIKLIKETLIGELRKRGYSFDNGSGASTFYGPGPQITSIRVKNEMAEEGKVPVSIEIKAGNSIYSGQYNATTTDGHLIFQPSTAPVKSDK